MWLAIILKAQIEASRLWVQFTYCIHFLFFHVSCIFTRLSFYIFTRCFGSPWGPKRQKQKGKGFSETLIHSTACQDLCLANLSSRSVMQGRNCEAASQHVCSSEAPARNSRCERSENAFVLKMH